MTAVLDLSIAEAHRLLRAGDVSSVELTEATLAQIERTEPDLHAYATVTADRALEDARRADEELRRRVPRGPLHGIPVAVKDLCRTRGIPTEAGSDVMRGNVPAEDSAVVERLAQGGAVLVGKTVTSEFALGPTLRPTRNAWRQDLSPEGSSAGSAVAVAARSAFAAIGTDTAGSIRAPAGVNGVVGLKPTFGLVSNAGTIPMAPSLDHIGPITRNVADCAAVLSVIAGFDPRDPFSLDVAAPSADVEQPADLSGVRLAIERTHLTDPAIDPAARQALERAASVLADLGATIVEVKIPQLDLVEAAIVTIKAVESSMYHLPRLGADGPQYARTTRVILQAGAAIPATQYRRAQQARVSIRAAVREVFCSYRLDALLEPGWGPPQPFDDHPVAPFTFPMRGNTVNLTGMPALNVPCGFAPDGLPLGGFEIWGRPLGEATILHIAARYESVHRWHEWTPGIATTGGGAV